jgi:alcohol dehydrogenase (NADP+)
MPIQEYLGMLDIGGTMVYVGIPEVSLLVLPPTLMVGNNSALKGSNTGSKKEVLRMLELAVRAGVESWIAVMPMTKCVDAIERVERGAEISYRA